MAIVYILFLLLFTDFQQPSGQPVDNAVLSSEESDVQMVAGSVAQSVAQFPNESLQKTPKFTAPSIPATGAPIASESSLSATQSPTSSAANPLVQSLVNTSNDKNSFSHVFNIPFEPINTFTVNYSTTFDSESEIVYVHFHQSKELVALHPDGRMERFGTLTVENAFPEILLIHILPGSDTLLAWNVGLGPVLEVDLPTRTITRVDRSHIEAYMIRHTPAVDNTGKLFAVGGYGFWEYRSKLLYFDRNTGGWEPMPVTTSDEPLPFAGGRLIHLEDENSLLLIGYIHLKSERYAQVLTYDLNENRWTPHGFYRLSLPTLDLGEHMFGISNHTIDAEKNLVYVDGILFYDRNKKQFLSHSSEKADREIVSNHLFRAYYSEKRGRWVRVGTLRNQQDLKVVYETWDSIELSPLGSRIHLPAKIIDNNDVVHYTVNPVILLRWLVGVLSLVILGGLVYIAKTEWHRKAQRAHPGLTLIRDEKGERSVRVGNRILPMEDAVLHTLFDILAEMKTQNVDSIPLTELDARLFPRQTNATAISKNRTRIITYVNEEAGEEVLSVDRSSFDKRFRILKINLSKISVEA